MTVAIAATILILSAVEDEPCVQCEGLGWVVEEEFIDFVLAVDQSATRKEALESFLREMPHFAHRCGACSVPVAGSRRNSNQAPVSLAAAGKLAFVKYTCAVCHGETGRGDGPAGGALPVKPRDYTDPVWQDSISDADMKSVITKGGEANGLSNLMAAYPQIPEEELDQIVAFIRSLRK